MADQSINNSQNTVQSIYKLIELITGENMMTEDSPFQRIDRFR